jgi:hypothetical protein
MHFSGHTYWQWKLKGGDKLDWEWKVIEGQMSLVVTKV